MAKHISSILIITIYYFIGVTESSPFNNSLISTCPLYFWRNNDVCNEDTTRYYGDRCRCTTDSSPNCCLQNSTFIRGQSYDSHRTQSPDLVCAQDCQLGHPMREEREESNHPRGSPGYLLTSGHHSFEIGILPLNYTCDLGLEIYWELNLHSTSCSDDDTKQDWQCDGQNWESIGLHVSNTSGMVEIQNQMDLNNSIDFYIRKLACSQAMEYFDGKMHNYSDCKWPDIVGNGELIITRAVSKCDSECYDGRIYPFSVPIWYGWDMEMWADPPQHLASTGWKWWNKLSEKSRIMVVVTIVVITIAICLCLWDCYRRKKNVKRIEHIQLMVPVSAEGETIDIGESI